MNSQQFNRNCWRRLSGISFLAVDSSSRRTGAAALCALPMQTTFNLSSSPAIITQLETILQQLRSIPPQSMAPLSLPILTRTISDLEKMRTELQRVLVPTFDVYTQAKGEAKPTDFNSVKFYAEKIGLPEREAEAFWNYFCAKGWRVGAHAMKSWTHALVNWKLRWEERRITSAPNGHSGNGPTLVDREMRHLERIASTL